MTSEARLDVFLVGLLSLGVGFFFIGAGAMANSLLVAVTGVVPAMFGGICLLATLILILASSVDGASGGG